MWFGQPGGFGTGGDWPGVGTPDILCLDPPVEHQTDSVSMPIFAVVAIDPEPLCLHAAALPVTERFHALDQVYRVDPSHP